MPGCAKAQDAVGPHIQAAGHCRTPCPSSRMLHDPTSVPQDTAKPHTKTPGHCRTSRPSSRTLQEPTSGPRASLLWITTAITTLEQGTHFPPHAPYHCQDTPMGSEHPKMHKGEGAALVPGRMSPSDVLGSSGDDGILLQKGQLAQLTCKAMRVPASTHAALVGKGTCLSH